MSNKKIQIVRKRDRGGAGMYRVYCEACNKWCQGRGRSAYQTFWSVSAGAERAADAHQTEHEARSITKRPLVKGVDLQPLNCDYEFIFSIPTLSVMFDK